MVSIPRSRPLRIVRQIIEQRARSVVVERPVTTVTELDEETSTLEQHTEQMWLHSPDERITREPSGERTVGELQAHAAAHESVDLKVGDRITHGGVEYEIDAIIGRPTDEQPDGDRTPETEYWVIDFVRRQ